MGSILPIATTAIQAFQTVGQAAAAIAPVAGVVARGAYFLSADNASQRVDARQLAQSQQLQEQLAVEKAALEKQELSVKAGEVEKARREALKRAVARQRANFGSSGVSVNGGSSEAVLLGLFDESETDKAARERLDTLKVTAIDQSLNQQKRVNTLQRAQLQQTQKLKNQINPFDAAKEFLNIF